MVDDNGGSPWSQYRVMVIKELERINSALEKIGTDLAELRTEVALLKLKASVWGVLAGAVSGAVITLGAILLRASS